MEDRSIEKAKMDEVKIKNLSYDVIRDYNKIINSWNGSKKRVTLEDRTSLIKSISAKYIKDVFSWSIYSHHFRRCAFILSAPNSDEFSIEILAYRPEPNWWQQRFQYHLNESIKLHSAESMSYTKEESNTVPTSEPIPVLNLGDTRTIISFQGNNNVFDRVNESIDSRMYLPYPNEDGVSFTPTSISEEIDELINFNSIINIKF